MDASIPGIRLAQARIGVYFGEAGAIVGVAARNIGEVD
jgi:hypothetical protein